MKKYLWIFFILIPIVVISIYLINKGKGNDEYTAEKTVFEMKNTIEDNNKNSVDEEQNEENIEKEIAEFSTRLPKDTKAREDNIKLACKTISGTEVKAGETFSFWDSLGCPTKEKGYKEAKTFTSDGKVTQSYGGGVCQISTTIYNAALKVEGLKIIERHEHSRDVSYIKDGKDAAVSYNTADLKFKNTLDYDIKIEAKVEENKVKIKLIRI